MSTLQGPLVCVVIGRTRHRMMQAEMQEAARQGARLIELRLDFLTRPPDFKRLLDNRPCPMIATFRRPEDGGRWNGDEEQRLRLIRHAIAAGFDYVDLEIDVIHQIPRFGTTKRIVSYHNLQGVPEKLELIHQQMCEEDADIVKIAVTAQRTSDNLRVMALLKNPPKPTVAFCMGDLGTCSRVLALGQGMPYTYGAFNKERHIAPGVQAFRDLHQIYRIESINAETKFFGVIGDPVSHSLSPLIHNAAFQELGINARYLPFRVPRGELGDFLNGFRAIPVHGYSVTLPQKETAAKLADEMDEETAAMCAANTLVMTEKGYRAANTDARAAMESLRANLPSSESGQPGALARRSALILGAGGVARAVAFGLKKEGVPFVITNRTPERGMVLALETGARFVEWVARHNVECDTIINCTSIGMHPNVDESPIHPSMLRAGMLVFDTVYTPETTMLIRDARERGCHTLTGVDMFVRQAGLQFQLFTGQAPPLDMMMKLVRQALSPVQVRDEPAPEPQPEAAPPRLLFLIGYRGSGKTTIAQLLADRLGWIWADADAVLEDRYGKTIKEIFAEEGEEGFRAKEAAILEELCGYDGCVIATGGGVILREDNRECLKRGPVVWLQAPADVLWQRLQGDPATAEQRPDLAQGGLAEIEELLKARSPLYEACQNLTVDATQPLQQIVETISAWCSEPIQSAEEKKT
jgi:3-dehydroquinate dehydratase/shikimate dehydrogenase